MCQPISHKAHGNGRQHIVDAMRDQIVEELLQEVDEFHGCCSVFQYSPKIRAISPGSRLTVRASARSRRAFWGFRLSAIRKPCLVRRVLLKVRPLPARVDWTTTMLRRTASASGSRSPGPQNPGAKPADTIPCAPASMKARTAVPSEPVYA